MVVSEEGVFDSKIVCLSEENFKKNNYKWEDYYLPQYGEIITEIDLFEDHTVIYVEKDGVKRREIFS